LLSRNIATLKGNADGAAFGGVHVIPCISPPVLRRVILWTTAAVARYTSSSKRWSSCKNKFESPIRTGAISCEDNPERQPTEMDSPEWQAASLVTPRHVVRTQWNNAALERHCKQAGVQRFICPAEDAIDGRSLTLVERYAVALRASTKSNGRRHKADLIDVANGTRGEIVDIVLDPREPPVVEEPVVRLQYPPLLNPP